MIFRIYIWLFILSWVFCDVDQEGEFSSVFEQWISLSERNDKVMKKPQTPPDRFIVNKPTKETPHLATNNKEVSETDLFLLGAIEKLAFRLETLEKRVQRTEEMLYEVIAGSNADDKQEPCPEHFQRYGGICYHTSTKQMNWKSASSMCRSLGSVLAEFETPEERKHLIVALQVDPSKRGDSYWTGGLNPGLLWIWGNSAKPVATKDGNAEIGGNGRCLLLAYEPPTQSYKYKGADCSTRYRFICRYNDNATERQLERLQRKIRSNSTEL